MKKIEKLLTATVMFWTLVVTSVMAQHRSMQELDAIANSVFPTSGARSTNRMLMGMTSSQVLKSVPKEQSEAFYVYTSSVGEDKGFAIVSGDNAVMTTNNEGDVDYEGVPTSISQISNSKVYTVRCARGTLGIQNGGLVANSREDITLEAQQFVLYNYKGRFYLYNLENQAFVKFEFNEWMCNWYTIITSKPTNANIVLKKSDNNEYPFMIGFNNYWLNVNEEYEAGVELNTESQLNEGNQFRLEPVGVVSEAVQESIKRLLEANANTANVILPWGTDDPWVCTYYSSKSLNEHIGPENDASGRSWTEVNYDDSSWPTLTGPIASSDESPLISYGHLWDGDIDSYNLRRKFILDKPLPELARVYFRAKHNGQITVFLNGKYIFMYYNNTGYGEGVYEMPLDAFVVGQNVLSINVRKNTGESYLDYKISYDELPNPFTDEQGIQYLLSAKNKEAIVVGTAPSLRKDITIPLFVDEFAVTGIASGAFADVDSLASVTMLLETPYAIPEDAFSDVVYKNAKLIVPYGCESVYKNTVGWSKFCVYKNYTDEQGVAYTLNEDGETYMVKGYAKNLKAKVVIPEMLHGKSVTVIGYEAFKNATSLKEISLPEGLLHIGDFSFVNTNLTEMTVPNSVTTIENGAFNEIATLKKVHIGKGVSMIVSDGFFYVGYNPFQHCIALETITVDEENRLFSSFKGLLYDKDKTILCAVPGSLTSLKETDFPSTLSVFAAYSLCGARVQDVVVPAHVSVFDDACFQDCVQMKSLTILSHATNLCNTILRYCFGLENLYIHAYYPDRSFANSELLEYTKENCIVHVTKGMRQAYVDKMKECGRSRVVADDIELPSVIDVDYSLGYDVKNLGLNAPKLGVGLLMTKEEAKAYAGCKIMSVQFCVHPWGDSELSAFVTKGVGGEQVAYASIITATCDGWRKLVFDTPYTITGEEELFIGMNSSTSTGVNYTNMQVPEGKLWFDWGGLEGTNWQPWSDAEGALAIAYTIEGDNLPANIRMTDATLTADEQGNHRIKGKLESCTIGLVDGCDIAYSINGGEPVTTHLDLQMVAKRHYEFEIPVSGEVGAGKNQVDVWVTKVGDRPDGIDSDSHAQFTLVGQSERYERKVVVEEGTGTWCGYCPRGIVGMRTMLENHPDNFIPIAVHDDDNMYSSSYGELNWRFGGFPACTMNRKYDFDPNAADLEKFYQQEVNQAVARIDMEAQWADEAQTKVQIKTVSRFAFDMTEEYRIAYAVTESGVGPYPQANYYSGGEEMGGFEKEPGAVSILHDHVARSISALNGEPGSVPVQPKGMTDYEYSYTLSLPDNIDNKENIQLVVLLINQETGEIVNADNVRFSGISVYDQTVGIDEIIIEEITDNCYHDLQGRPINGYPTQKGIYIINNKKVLVR